MYKNKTFLAIIPARSGSKEIVDKNIKLMKGNPLLSYTINASMKSNLFDEIIVSTDSMKYAEIAKEYGASVPFLRPKDLASDEAATSDVIVHVLDGMRDLGKNFDYFMLLQPTSPLRNEKHILESARILFEEKADTVISICKVEHPSNLNVKLDKEGQLEAPFLNKKQIRRQEVAKEYRINGAIYLTNTEFFLKNKSFYGGRTYPLLMDMFHSVDIDEEFDFTLADFLLNRYEKST